MPANLDTSCTSIYVTPNTDSHQHSYKLSYLFYCLTLKSPIFQYRPHYSDTKLCNHNRLPKMTSGDASRPGQSFTV